MALWILVCMIVVPAIGGFYLSRGKAKTLARLKAKLTADIRNRLTSIAREVGGSVSEGAVLDTARGKMSLVASKAPESYVVDLAKFVGKTDLSGAVTVVRREDASKVIATRNLRVLEPKDPMMAEHYHVLVSDVEEGQRWATAKLAEKLRALETGVRARCRVQVAGGTATVFVFRNLAKAEELKAFYDGAVGVIDALDGSSRPTS